MDISSILRKLKCSIGRNTTDWFSWWGQSTRVEGHTYVIGLLRYCMAKNGKLTCVQTSDHNSWCFTAIHSKQCALLPQLAVKLLIPHLGRAADRLDQTPALCPRPSFFEQLLLSTWSLTGFSLETMPFVFLETHVQNGGTATRKKIPVSVVIKIKLENSQNSYTIKHTMLNSSLHTVWW